MRKFGFCLVGLAVVLFLGMFVCWAAVIWGGDMRWGETSQVIFFPMLAAGGVGGLMAAFGES